MANEDAGFEIPDELPVLPLREFVVFPYMVVPLFVGREASIATLEEKFGPNLGEIVEGVTKLSKLRFTSREDRQAESFRKMVLAMARDIRVILVKLADRLHNMRTLEHLPAEKQRRIARETLEIYVPIAHRLGIGRMKEELEDMAFKYNDPERYASLKKRLEARQQRDELVQGLPELRPRDVIDGTEELKGVYCRQVPGELEAIAHDERHAPQEVRLALPGKVSKHAGLPRCRVKQAGEHLQSRGLAGAVGAQKADDFSRFNAEANIFHGLDQAMAPAHQTSDGSAKTGLPLGNLERSRQALDVDRRG